MPRNIDSTYSEKTNWQIIDSSRFVNPTILEYFSWKVNVIFVHILAVDMLMVEQDYFMRQF